MGISGGPDTIQDGLVLSVDAADRNSYVSGSTVWNDVSGNGNNGTLTNGPTFSSTNGGSIVFDGVNDYVTCGTNSSILVSSMTISSIFSFTSYTNATHLIVSRLGGPAQSYRHNYFFGIMESKFYFGFNQSGTSNYPLVWINTSPIINTIYSFTATYSTSTSVAMYLNGQVQSFSGPNTAGNPLITNQAVALEPATICSIGSGAPAQDTFYSNARIYNAQIYNRVLSASEVLQNYNAQKSRFNL
jgi:TM2 domain-containing membrane protein YozV